MMRMSVPPWVEVTCTSRNLSVLELQKVPNLVSEPRTQLQVSLSRREVNSPQNLVQSLSSRTTMVSRAGEQQSGSLGSCLPTPRQ